MKRLCMFFFLLFFLGGVSFAYTRFFYLEQWYSLFTRRLKEGSNDYLSNIYYLERALHSPFINPRFALSPISDAKKWQKYRYLFYTHINLKLIEQYLLLGNRYDVSQVKFYQAPFKKEILENLNKAEELYKIALLYWKDVLKWNQKVEEFPFIDLDKVQYWQDEAYRIQTKQLDYEKIITRHLNKIQKAREELQKLNETSY